MRTHTRLFIAIFIVLVILGTAAITPTTAKPMPHFMVPGEAGWFDTGLVFTAGDSVSITAHGQAMTGALVDYPDAHSDPDGQVHICSIYNNPFTDCAMEGAPYGALVGKFGAGGTPFLVGSSYSGIAGESGELFLAVNDNLPYYEDNFGGFIVFVGP